MSTRDKTALGWLTEMTAAGYLLSRGAHFVLYRLDDPKKPAWKRYDRLRPTIDDVGRHEGPLGIFPFSLGCSVIDVDEGPPGPLIDAARQLEHYITDYPSLGGSHGPDATHLWLRDRQPRKPNAHVEAFGRSYQVLSLAPPAILRGDALTRLAEGIERADPPRRTLKKWPDPFVQLRWPFEEAPARPAGKLRGTPSPELADAVEGNRNVSLFYALASAARKVVREYESYHTFHQELRDVAFGFANLMGQVDGSGPETAAKVEATARSVANRVWNFDRKAQAPEAQSQKGRASGRARRKATAERDGRMWRHVELGFSKRQIAAFEDVSLKTVKRVTARQSAQVPMFGDAPPGQPEGQRTKTANRNAEARELDAIGLDAQEIANRLQVSLPTVYRALEPDKKAQREKRDAKVRELDAQGVNKTEIAKTVGITRYTVAAILKKS